MSSNILSVGELTRRIKSVLETDFSNVAISGEISNFKRHSSGHLYFTLKDENAQISAVLWRGRAANLFFSPQDGMKVVARGSITVYEPRGNYQIDCISLQPLGIGELQLAFERLKQKLATEGLFEQENKKPLPQFPERIGIVTSPTGAALQDMLNIISRRFPSVEVILYPVKVQGTGAAEEIATAIKDFNKFGDIDVLIIGRGGGSLEDLWAFNEEVVARAIFASKIPVVSAVGHEIDFTIADFVADLRAPTPSAAAELVVPNKIDVVESLHNYYYTLEQILSDTIQSHRETIESLLKSYSFNRPFDLLRQYSQRSDELKNILERTISHRFTFVKQHLDSLQHRLASVDPQQVLKRGYAMVYRDGKVVSSAVALSANEEVEMQFHDGRKRAEIV
ncbi:MAG: exodeoxyribonuclease VII large subunit [Ignavibacteriales bacterium]|nr:exodeoxyribonuclease VII large subunit [Ignavibacteriales bacterium]